MPGERKLRDAQSLPSKIVLIVEDDQDIGEFLCQLVNDETPFRGVLAQDGYQALAVAPQVCPDLFLIDYRMPGMNGIELFDHLQEVNGLRGIPTIMISATLPMAELRKRSMYSLRKPVDINRLIELVTQAIVSRSVSVPVHEHSTNSERA